ncbi:tetratricopeptide repeat protein [bacterium]|nr:tetratricopeptide repeat protein [bacterium]
MQKILTIACFVLACLQAMAQNVAKRLEAVDDYIIEENYEYAEKLLIKILAKDNGIHQAHYKLALVRWQDGHPKKALEEAVIAVQQKPEEPNYHALLGKIWVELNEGQKALEQFDAALLIDSLLPEALLYRGDYYFENQYYQKAIRDYKTLKKVVSAEPQIYHRIGKAYKADGQCNQAISYFTKCLQINPIDFETRWFLAQCYFEIKQYTDAVFELNQLQKLNPLDEQLCLRAQCYAWLNKLDLAKADMLEAYSRHSDDINYLIPYIAIEERLGNYEHALHLADLLIAKFPVLRPLQVLKGRLLALSGDYAKAEKSFRLAINQIEEQKTPFVIEAKAYINCLNWLSQGLVKPIAHGGCDSMAIYSYVFNQLAGNAVAFDCDKEALPYFAGKANETHNLRQKMLLCLGMIKRNEAPEDLSNWPLLMQVLSPLNYQQFEYHIADLLLHHVGE